MKYIIIAILNILATISFSQNNWENKIEPVLKSKFDIQKQQSFIVILNSQTNTKTQSNWAKSEKGNYVYEKLLQNTLQSQRSAISILDFNHISYQSFYIYNAILVKNGTLDLLKQLANLPEVNRIIADFSLVYHTPVEKIENNNRGLFNWGISMIQADSVWLMGIKGDGVVIGGQDTGYDWKHPAIKSKYRGFDTINQTTNHNYNWHDAIHERNPAYADSLVNPCGFDSKEPCDDNSHGTHTMGTMVGSIGENEVTIGIAPNSKWIGARNMDRGWGKLSTYLEAFEWLLAPTDSLGKNPKPNLAPHVINNSWYCSLEEGCNPSNWGIMDTVMNSLRDAGIVVVISAGNAGGACGTVTGPPALFQNSFAIGATAINDTIAGFSSRGPVFYNNISYNKPNVSAPGVNIPSSVPNGGYSSYSGTSMAGPHVAGAVALIISANPTLAGKVDLIESILEETAEPKTTNQDCDNILGMNVPNAVYGYGRINVYKAVKKALKITNNQDFTINNINIYPNPTNSILNIEKNSSFDQEILIEVYNQTGQIVQKTKKNFSISNFIDISVEQLPVGLYSILIKNDRNIFNGKFLKN